MSEWWWVRIGGGSFKLIFEIKVALVLALELTLAL